MPNVQFGSTIVDVPEEALRNPAAMKQIAHQISFTKNVNETDGADAATRFAVGAAEKSEDQLATLKAKGFDAARIGDDLYYKDEAGKSRRVNPQGLDWGDLAGAAPEMAETAGSVLGGVLGGAAGIAAGPGAVATAMAGSAAGGVLGREGAQWLGRQFFDTQDTRTGLERLADVGTTAALNAGGEGLARAAGGVVKGFRGSFNPDPYQHLTNRAAFDAGIDLNAAQAMPNALTRRAEDYALQSPVSRPAMERALTAQQQALQQNLQRVGGQEFQASRLAGKPVLDDLAADPDTWAFPTVDDLLRARARDPDFDAVGQSLHHFAQQGEDAKRLFVKQTFDDLGVGGADFNARTFLQKFKALPDTERGKLGLSGELGKELNALIRVAQSVEKQQTRTGKPLATPLGSLLNTLGIVAGYGAGGVPGAVGGVMGPYAVSRLLTWPRFVKFLSRPVENPGQFSRRLSRLAVQAGKEGYAEEIDALLEKLQGQGAGEEK